MEIYDGMQRPERMFLSIVVPCCNEEEGLREFHRRMTATARALFGQKFELILVDDGSTDNTWKVINQLSAQDRNVVAVRLSRNHGHQLALTAGLSTVRGDLVLVIDADLQDPPELLDPMYDLMVREDADVVFGQRRSRAGESGFKKKSAEAFYRLLANLTRVNIPVDTGDFRLMSRRISDQVVQMPEHDRFIRGMVAWLGFKQVAFEYDRNARFAGITKYPLTKMIGFAADALVSFSMVPLRIATYIGALLTTVLTFVGIWAVIGWILSGTVPGWTSLTLLVVMISSVQLLVLGLIGEYVGRTYIQSKHRPLFVISHIHRRARLSDRLPHDPPPGGKSSSNSPFKAPQTGLDTEAHEPLLDEIEGDRRLAIRQSRPLVDAALSPVDNPAHGAVVDKISVSYSRASPRLGLMERDRVFATHLQDLIKRIGSEHVERRLEIETRHEAQLFGQGLLLFNVENWRLAPCLIKFVLQVSGLYAARGEMPIISLSGGMG